MDFPIPHGPNRTMSPRPSSSSSGTGTGPGTGTATGSGNTTTSQFTFVTGNIQSEARSHAMREHWKRRHKRNQEAKSSTRKKASTSASRTLLPRSTSASNGEEEGGSTATTSSSGLRPDGSLDGAKKHSQPGIPAQMFCGMSYALSSARPDPFQTCPVHLTSQHQKLLHHCAFSRTCVVADCYYD